jgi:hypothetical protein
VIPFLDIVKNIVLRAEMADASIREVLLVLCRGLNVKSLLIMGYSEETAFRCSVSVWNFHVNYQKI